jgi:hypothetical protein
MRVGRTVEWEGEGGSVPPFDGRRQAHAQSSGYGRLKPSCSNSTAFASVYYRVKKPLGTARGSGRRRRPKSWPRKRRKARRRQPTSRPRTMAESDRPSAKVRDVASTATGSRKYWRRHFEPRLR